MLDQMSNLLGRLTAAGWISGSYLNGQSLRIVWTPAGLQKATILREAITDLDLLQMSGNDIACLLVILSTAENAPNLMAHTPKNG